MPGFRGCSWCQGRGCMCCEAERTKHEKRQAEEAERRAREDPRVALARLEDPLTRQVVEQFSGKEGLAALDADIVEARARCDAEYDRLFPNGPTPIFTMKRNNPDDIALLRSFAGGPALDEIFAGGVTPEATEEMLRRADRARTIQSARKVLCPNEADRANGDAVS